MWIDRVVELQPREKMVAIKNVSLAEEHLHDHFEVDAFGPATPVMPASLIIEGVAQTAGILVGHAEDFAEKVLLAKISKAKLEREATPGCTLRYSATVQQLTAQGASTSTTVELFDHADADAGWSEIGAVEIVFSHADQNMAGLDLPEHNFVFGEGFKTLLRTSGVDVPGE